MIETMKREDLRVVCKRLGLAGYAKISKVADLRAFILSKSIDWDARLEGLEKAVERLGRRRDKPSKSRRNERRLASFRAKIANIRSLLAA